MSYLKTKRPENVIFEGFSGIDTRFLHAKRSRTTDMCNFRICSDGSLKKRRGFIRNMNISEEIRAVWTGMIYGEEKCILLLGNKVSLYSRESGRISSSGVIETSSGRACFFYYRDRLYLADGQKIYELHPTTFSPSVTIGYIPLIGKDWTTGKRGDVYEKRNLLCNHARISYKIESFPSIYLHTGWEAKSIDAIYLNGTLLSPSQYTYNTIFKSIELGGLSENDEVLVYVTYHTPENEDITQGLLTCTDAINFGDLNGDRMFMWGGTKKNTLYCSKYVLRESMEESRKANSNSSSLYFPVGYEFAAGDGRHDIRAAIRHYDRLLVFTDGDAWNVLPSANGDDDVPLLSINKGAGCASMGAVEMADNSPISVGKHTIFSWNSETDEYNECNATSISSPIDSLLSENFYKNAIVFNAKKHKELWFHAFGEESTWIYNIDRKDWYRFTGFDAQGFFEFDGEIFFFDKTSIYRFDDRLICDVFSTSSIELITSSFTSDILEFSTPAKKRLSHAFMSADTDDDMVTMILHLDEKENVFANFKTPSSNDHGVLNQRLHSGRFKYAVLKLYSLGEHDPIIHSLEIGVR